MEDPLGQGFQSARDVAKFLDDAVRNVAVHKYVVTIESREDKIPEWLKEKPERDHYHSISHDLRVDGILFQVYDRFGHLKWRVPCTQGKNFVVMPLLPRECYPVKVVLIG